MGLRTAAQRCSPSVQPGRLRLHRVRGRADLGTDRHARAEPTGVAGSPNQPVRVAVIVMENHGYNSVVGLPYIRTIATSAATLTDYHASAHPSLPNYLALTSGSTWGIT